MSGPDLAGLAARESGGADLGPLPIACPHCGDELTAAERESVRCGRCADTGAQVGAVAEARALLAAATPGPWSDAGSAGFGSWIVAGPPEGHRGQVAVVYGHRVTPEADGNAGLIAAAPRLLAALASECERLSAALAAAAERAELAEARLREATDHVSSLLRREQEQRERAERAEERCIDISASLALVRKHKAELLVRANDAETQRGEARYALVREEIRAERAEERCAALERVAEAARAWAASEDTDDGTEEDLFVAVQALEEPRRG